MRVKAQPIVSTPSRTIPRGSGYTYQPGQAIVSTQPPPAVATFGTSQSPTNLGSHLLPPGAVNPSSLRGFIGSTFSGSGLAAVTNSSNTGKPTVPVVSGRTGILVGLFG